MPEPHPLLAVLLAAADGVFPPADGTVRFLPPLVGGMQAVVSLTGHAAVATSLPREAFHGLGLDGFGAALRPEVLLLLAGSTGVVGDLDVTLVARGTGGGGLPLRTDLDDHPRVRYARAQRSGVLVHGDERGLVTLASGLAGRVEMSVEAAPQRQGGAVGRSLITDALALVPVGAPAFAAVAPGNARSLRAFLAAGFVPVGSEVLVSPG
ncbi:hypothetical protein [Kutzneria albida]|uniref:N-acetyltransferase domain-containing protein n=1 Tax=Kutzneria albida DSM 43870 TaxID=1449976 RepID=W5WEZ9_9PSEU|nr:hypothetical protein [Kutzneria albida]AHH99340.1 hypothetical protein KALB_5980 [Kutzneria albida DSM 43870]